MKQRHRPTVLERLDERVMLTGVTATVSIPPPAVISGYSYTGVGNNLTNPSWGATSTDLLRTAPAAYGDGVSTPAGSDRPSARDISNTVSDQGDQDTVNDKLLSAMFYAWGQFVDHDIDRTPTSASAGSDPIAVPQGDPSFDPTGTGTQTIPMTRSLFDTATGTTSPRQQVNTITAWLDGSMIYGSDGATAAALRTFQGGMLKTSAGNLLPINNAATFPTGTLPMDNDAHLVPDNQLFAAGDVRANENIELTSIQTLFVREHNHWAQQIASAHPGLSDLQIYLQARSIVIAEIQSITFNQWLPALLGPNAIAPYSGYKPNVNPDIANEFSTAAFRFGHSLLGNDVEFLDNNGLSVQPSISLSQAFTNPDLVKQTGIDPIIKYLESDPSSALDTKVVDSLRNMLFGPAGAGGLDLASLNIQRGRDHGLADYNTVRQAYGLPRVTDFSQITSDPAMQAKLQSLYGSVDNIDLWIGGLAEDHAPGAAVGPTFRAIIANQFSRIRDGDRFWYQQAFSGPLLQQIEHTTLTDIALRNTNLTNLQTQPFVFQSIIAGSVFADVNHNARLNAGEPGLPGITMALIDASTGDTVATTPTDAHGNYMFSVYDGLRTGRYTIGLIPAGATQAALTSRVAAITRGSQLVAGINFAIVPPPHFIRPPQPPRGPLVAVSGASTSTSEATSTTTNTKGATAAPTTVVNTRSPVAQALATKPVTGTR